MAKVATISVQQASVGWRVRRDRSELLEPTSQERAMLWALAEASRCFERGERVQVVLEPSGAAASLAA